MHYLWVIQVKEFPPSEYINLLRDATRDGLTSAPSLGTILRDVEAFVANGPAVVAVYAPWCQYCQAMEDEYAKLASAAGIPVAKFRGDEQRDFVAARLNTASFPTVNVITKDGDVVKYDSEERTVADFEAFINKTI